MAIVRAQPGMGAFQAAAVQQVGAGIRKIREAELGRQEHRQVAQR